MRKLSFLIYIIHSSLLFSFIGFTLGHPVQQLSNLSCGGLPIKFPFCLKGDQINCGDSGYEVTCSGNKTFLELKSVQFFVKKIDYLNQMIKIIEVGLLRSNCSLPSKSFTPIHFGSTERAILLFVNTSNWISFMNCSKELHSVKYQLIPCLSKKDSYVYSVQSAHVSDMAPYCSFLAMMPSSSYDSSYSDSLRVLRDGFYVGWDFDVSASWLVRRCLRSPWSEFLLNTGTTVFPSLGLRVVADVLGIPLCIMSYACNLNSLFKFILVMATSVLILIVLLLIVLHLIGRFVFAPITLCIFLAHKFWTSWSSEDVVEKFLQAQQSLSPIRYTYAHIIAITRHFKEQLGRGGFGSVYKGELPGGHFVAVKLLTGNSKCSGDDFISEVSTIGRIRHLNVVRLVGFCSEGSKRALIYEFMPNKSLDKYIFSSNRNFTWQKLNNIALGMARGINYLHCGCDMTILHFDIKPQNILLDQNFLPKISDFGLAKLYPKEYNAVSVSAARGTIGYIAPELVSRNFGVISHKSDVYSFGMMLMEMAAGRRNVDTNAGSSSQNYYPSLIYDRLNNDVKKGIEIECFEMNEVEKKLCLVGLWCIQVRPIDRPSMSQVLQMLEGEAKDLKFPPKPFFSCSSSIPRTLHSTSTATIELAIIDEDDSS